MKKGFLRIASDAMRPEELNMVRSAAEYCDELIIGIPDAWTYTRLYVTDIAYNTEALSQMWKQLPKVTDVTELSTDEITIEQTYEKIGYDVYFCGTEYGRKYIRDCEFAKEHGIEMVTLIPDANTVSYHNDGMFRALRNVHPTQKTILVGNEADRKALKQKYPEHCADAYEADSVSEIDEEHPENAFVILCDSDYETQRDILLGMGDYDYRIMRYTSPIAIMDEAGVMFADEKEYTVNCQKVLLDILKEFDTVCRAEHLEYFMLCGSLIGQLRHKGFIPWDDDLDIAMTRADYEKFAAAFNKKWGDDKRYRLRSVTDWKYKTFMDCMPRIVDEKKVFPTKINTNVCDASDNEFFVHKMLDIYILDEAYDEEWKHEFQMGTLKVIYNLAMGHRKNTDYSRYERLGPALVFLMKILNGIGKIIPLKWLLKLFDHVCRRANGKGGDSYFIGGMSIPYIDRKFMKEYFSPAQDAPFENMTVMNPHDPEGLMDVMGYINYMQLPWYGDRMPKHYFTSEIEIW